MPRKKGICIHIELWTVRETILPPDQLFGGEEITGGGGEGQGAGLEENGMAEIENTHTVMNCPK